MKDKYLIISEKFYSIQGEGITSGIPSVFIRLAGCNLLCKSGSWVCDSIEVWKKGTKTEFKNVLSLDEKNKIRQGAHLVFTGGEPMLQQDKIVKYLEWLREEDELIPFVEVETNGTIEPNIGMTMLVKQWNCSPKLPNSGEPYERRVNPIAIRKLSRNPSTMFKFVIKNDSDILDMIIEYFDYFKSEQVVLMPAGENQEQLEETRKIVVHHCMELGLRYCDRLHIVIWNQKTGV